MSQVRLVTLQAQHSRWTNIHLTYVLLLFDKLYHYFLRIKSDKYLATWHGVGVGVGVGVGDKAI